MARATLTSGSGAATNSITTGSVATAVTTTGDILALSLVPNTDTFVLSKMTPGGTVTTVRTWAAASPVSDYQIQLHANDSPVVLALNKNRTTLSYFRMEPDFTGGSWSTAYSVNSPATIEAWDFGVAPSGGLALSLWTYNGSNLQTKTVMWRTPSGAWTTPFSQNVGTSPGISRGALATAIVTLGNPTSTIRDIAFAHAHGKPSGSAEGDKGVTLSTIRVNESNGAIQGSVTHRTVLLTGEADHGGSIARGGRHIALYRQTGTAGSFAMVVVHRDKNRRAAILGAVFSGTTWSITTPTSTAVIEGGALGYIATTASGDGRTLNITYTRASNSPNAHIGNTIARLSGSTVTWSVNHLFEPLVMGYARGVGGQGNSHNTTHKIHSVVGMQTSTSNTIHATTLAWAAIPNSANAVKAITPANGSNVTSSTPPLSATIDLDISRGQSKYKMQYQMATDAGFTTNVRDYVQADNKYIVISGTDQNSGLVATDTWPSLLALTGGTWYFRGRLLDEFGNATPWKPAQQIQVGHPPVAIPLSPTSGGLYFYNEGIATLSWRFTDPSASDYQTAAQVQLFDHVGNPLMDTGKMSNFTNKSYNTPVIDPAYKDYNLSWRVRLWDSEDTLGEWSDLTYFALTDPPSASVSSPTANQTLTTGVPTFVASLITSGGRKIKEYTFSVTQAGAPVWSLRVTGEFTSPYTANIKIPQGYLKNNSSYSIQVSLRDSSNLSANSAVVPFNVAWTPPAVPGSIVLDTSQYNAEGGGYNLITWSGSSMETANFYGWAVYRLVYESDTQGGFVASSPVPELIHVENQKAIDYEFRDYFAPSGQFVRYAVTQLVNRDAQDMESNFAYSSTDPIPTESDGYWLISYDPDTDAATATRVNTVTADEFTTEQEEAEMNIIGRGRQFQKGQRLGVRGTLTAKLRNSAQSTARQKRQRLEQIQATYGALYLRNPFGDVYRVNVSNMGISRIAGVGTDEFVDVTIPYTEVAE